MTKQIDIMKTNDIFDFRRFGKYFASDIRTCVANYGLSLLCISLLLPLVIYVIATGTSILFQQTWDGPGLAMRAFTFGIAMFCIVVTMPVKCYGKITEKQYGSFWLTLPASRLEKFISMFLLTCIIVPLIGAGLYLGLDCLICALDKTCGTNLIAGMIELTRNIGELGNEFDNVKLNMGPGMPAMDIRSAEFASDMFKQLSSPWLYIDEIFTITLPFLLGAIFFKNGKTVKTFLAMAALSTALSLIMTPFITDYMFTVLNNASTEEQIVEAMMNSSMFKHMALIDTVSDVVVNTAMLVAIWFRIKTLKH